MVGPSSLQRGGRADDQLKVHNRPPLFEILLFAIGIIAIGLMLSPSLFANSSQRDLVDTDGYMRYLRIEELATGGEWFDQTSERSNYPEGETQHWSRAFDVVVIVLAVPLKLLVGDGALYWAAVLNGPVLLFLSGLALYRAAWFLERDVRRILMLLTLGLVPVTAYTSPGRVDHHALILLVFVLTLDQVIRLATGKGDSWIWLAVWVSVGLWVSTEFLVPAGLAGSTLALVSVIRSNRGLMRIPGIALLAATGLVALAVLLERGTDFFHVEYDKVSVAHVGLVAMGSAALLATWWWFKARPLENAFVLAGASVVGGTVFYLLFPDLLGGPFVDVDQRVRGLWLRHVVELHPVWSYPWTTVGILIGPPVVGLVAVARRLATKATLPTWILGGWLAVYTVLALYQVRWALFPHVIALLVILEAIGGWYTRLGKRRIATLVRPLLAVLAVFSFQLLSIAGSSADEADGMSCSPKMIASTLHGFPVTTVLAGEDSGPEILYRTQHRVIATPYHRNESGLLYVRDVLALPSERTGEIEQALTAREVGLILVCPGELMTPADPEGTFYGSLVDGPLPSFVEEVPLAADTDYRLFAVRS